MLAALILAADAAAKSKTPFYVLAAALVLSALSLAAVGIRNHETFPPSKGAMNALMAVFALLVAGTMITAVITA
jgi:hypothetical protein